MLLCDCYDTCTKTCQFKYPTPKEIESQPICKYNMNAKLITMKHYEKPYETTIADVRYSITEFINVPVYVKLSNNTVLYHSKFENVYCNDCAWHVEYELNDGKIIVDDNIEHLQGKELIPITKKEYYEILNQHRSGIVGVGN